MSPINLRLTPDHQAAKRMLRLCQLSAIADAWSLILNDVKPLLCVYWVSSPGFKVARADELIPLYEQWQSQLDWAGEVLWIAVNRLPYNAAGEIHVQALAELPVWDLRDRSSWQQQAQGLSAQQMPLAVTLVANRTLPVAWPLEDYLPSQASSIGSANAQPLQKIASPVIDGLMSVAIGPEFGLSLAERPPHLPALLRNIAKPIAADWWFYDTQGQVQMHTPTELLGVAELWGRRLLAAGLAPSTPIVLQIKPQWEFVQLLWGCILAGLLPIPVAVPPSYAMAGAELNHVQNVAHKLHAGVLVVTDDNAHEARLWQTRQALTGFQLFSMNELQSMQIESVTLPTDWDGEAPALMMFTSGSTGKPKGVPLTHRQLILRCLCTAELEKLQPESTSLNWMPLDHVAGLLMFHLRNVLVGCQSVFVATEYVLEDPLRWLILMDRHRVNNSFAPNFAFNLVMDHQARFTDYVWDLSCIKVITDGGEAVVPATARRFLQGLARFGLAETVLWPAWGMSETTSGVCYNRRLTLADLTDSAQFVSVGNPFPNTQIRLVDAQDQLVPEGEEGRLQIKGEMIFNGYFDAPELNAESFTADGWFRTGDLSRLVQGELTITGRDKDIIIINGVNYAGITIETAVESLAGVETSFTAACAVLDTQGQEQLAVFFVPKSRQPGVLLQLLTEIRRVVQAEAGLQPEFLLPLTEADIPKTSIGKIQRTQLKNAFAAGQFRTIQKQVDAWLGNARTVPNWFMQRCWQAQLPASRRFEGQGLADQQVSAPGVQVAVLGMTQQQINYLQQHKPDIVWLGWDKLPTDLSDLTGLTGVVDARFLLASLSADLAELTQTWQQLCDTAPSWQLADQSSNQAPMAWWILTEGAYRLAQDPYQQVDSATLAVATWVQALAQTVTSVRLRHIDSLGLSASQQASMLVEEVTDFIWHGQQLTKTPLVPATRAWRNSGAAPSELQAHIPGLQTVQPLAQPMQSRLHKSGSVLITGALGGIGQQLVGYLLQQMDMPLILVGRRAHSKAVQETLLAIAEQAAQQNQDRRATYLARLIYLQSDLTDADKLRTQLQEVLASQPLAGQTLAGMFHLAGQYRECLLLEETAADIHALIQPKLQGTRTLLALLKTYPAAYCVGFSSVVALLGGSTLGAYAAANAYLDALLAQHAAQGYDCLSLQWASWRNQGLSQVHADSLGLQPEILAARGVASMVLPQALASLTLALQQPAQTLAIGLYADHPENQLSQNQVQPLWQLQAYLDQSQLPVGVLPDLSLADRALRSWTVPVQWVPSLPITADGQIDYMALSEQAKPVRDVRPPQTPLEYQLLAFWQQCLQQDSISVTDAFFAIGGQSIVAMRLLGLINAAFGLSWSLPQLLRHSTIAAQAQALAEHQALTGETTAAGTDRIIQRQATRSEGLSDAQRRIWLVCQMDPHSRIFHVPAQIILDEVIDVARATAALQGLWQRHDSLRCVFPLHTQTGEPYACLLNAPEWPLEVLEVDQQVDWLAHTREFSERDFDLQAGPLCRAQLVLTPNGHGRLLLSLHHIITDGWSMKILFDEWLKLYDQPNQPLPELPIRYADYVAWQQQQNQSPIKRNLDYWQQQLQGAEQGFTLPTDLPRPSIQRYHGKSLHQWLPTALADKLRQLAQQRQVSPFALFLAAYQLLLARYSQQTDIVLGIMIANRDQAEVTGLVGMFVNPLVLRVQYDPALSFNDWLDVVQQISWQAYEHHGVPFEQVVDRLKLARDTSRSPLFQIAFDYRDPQIVLSPRAGVSLQVMQPDLGVVQFDLQLTLQEQDQGLELIWHWNTDLFHASTLQRLAANYQQLLSSISAEPTKPLGELNLLTSVEQQQLRRFAQQVQRFTPASSWLELFRQQVQARPQQPALCMAEGFSVEGSSVEGLSVNEKLISYQQLDQLSTQWAKNLYQQGVRCGDLVGICLPAGMERVIAVLAVLKVAAAYVPLDPYYPQARLNYMLADAQANWLVIDAQSAAGLICENVRIVPIAQLAQAIADDAIDLPEPQPQDLAYMIYTSGSTGKPKGVRVPHLGWLNVAQAQQQVLGMQPGWRVLQFAAFSFDAAAFELVMALASGGTLCIAAREQLLPGADLYATFKTLRINTATLAATALLAMPDADLPDLKMIAVAGEACPQALPQRFAQGRRFFNLYGPTEATIWASYCEVSCDVAEAPPIGRPVPNDELWVLDQHQQLLPQGMPGMLYIGGAGITQGYHRQPELTAERFMALPALQRLRGAVLHDKVSNGAVSPNIPADRYYQSGDLVKWNEQGELIFLGRADDQIKIRGFRIELGEIENQLLQQPDVQAAVVIVDKDRQGDSRLIAYVMPKVADELLDLHSLRDRLRQRLPEFMLPNVFVPISAVPLSPTGKVDKRALPDPDQHITANAVQQLATDPLEQQISGIWQQVLDLEQVDITQNFFDLGGHSMKLAQVRAQLQQQLQQDVPLVVLFQYPTIARLAAYLRDHAQPSKAADNKIDDQKQRQQDARQRLLQQRNRILPKR